MSSEDTAFFGHPRGLSTLFFTEMWERFSYYGMRAFLILYMTQSKAVGAKGMSAQQGGIVLGIYLSSVYLFSLPGGWLADRFLGQRRAVTIGGTLIMVGHVVLAIPADATFYLGLTLVAIGTGLLKPNISTLVGELYAADDPRRDRGFSIYYMGINVGALLAPLACGYLAQSDTVRAWLAHHGMDPGVAWHIAFGAAAIGMGAGLVQFLLGTKHLGTVGAKPVVAVPKEQLRRETRLLLLALGGLAAIVAVIVVLHGSHVITVDKALIGNLFGIGLAVVATSVFALMFRTLTAPDERRRLLAMLVLFIGCAAFFAIFEQAASSLDLFADRFNDNSIFGWHFASSWWNSVNSIYVLILTPPLVLLWGALAKRRREPSSVTKFSIAMMLTAASMFVMLPAAHIVAGGAKAGPGWLATLYLFSTLGELCLSPVGLASMSALAPPRLASMVMSVWFLAIGIGEYFAGRAASLIVSMSLTGMFAMLGSFCVVIAVLLWFAAAPVARRLAKDALVTP